MKHNILLILLIFIIAPVSAQLLHLEDSVEVFAADLISIDQQGNLFLTDIKGNIYQYSKDLKSLRNYSPPKPFKITQLDVWQGLRIFCFYRDLQEFVLLDRFLTASGNYIFDLPSNGFISHATLAYDNNLWLIDQPGMKLLKYNINQRRTELEIPLNNLIPTSMFNILVFQEYQNKIFIVDEKNGVFVFDNSGNYISSKKIEAGRETGLFEDFIFYVEDSIIVYKNLYNQDQDIISIPDGRKADKVIRNKNNVYLLDGKVLYKYRIN